MVEYVLLLCIAASLAIGFNTFFRQAVGFGILRFNAVLESELRSGEFENPSTVGMWEN